MNRHRGRLPIVFMRYVAVFIGALMMTFAGGCEDTGISRDIGDNNPNVYVAIGDSITEGVGVPEAYPEIIAAMTGKAVVNGGVSGSVSDDGVGRIGGMMAAHKPSYVFILYGANDVIRGYDPQATVGNLHLMVEAAKGNKTVPIVATLTPMIRLHEVYVNGVLAVNEQIREMASDEGVPLADLASVFAGHEMEYLQEDGLHPNSAGQAAIAGAFMNHL